MNRYLRLIVRQTFLSLGLVFVLWWVMEVVVFVYLWSVGGTVEYIGPWWDWPRIFYCVYCGGPAGWAFVQAIHGISYATGALILLLFNMRAFLLFNVRTFKMKLKTETNLEFALRTGREDYTDEEGEPR